ncbi:uncharacterized protein HKW66_Vig0180180 [Vigna angularis]|uniref:Uncharacterized protein n=1 Tax=Phaseolus angularis TaxID=3914 RepID=A0A8T0K4M3_PHAAN|nr:uncharacterized protein HKW66_Vig0180180 [Vigna angularis]
MSGGSRHCRDEGEDGKVCEEEKLMSMMAGEDDSAILPFSTHAFLLLPKNFILKLKTLPKLKTLEARFERVERNAKRVPWFLGEDALGGSIHGPEALGGSIHRPEVAYKGLKLQKGAAKRG